MTRNHQHHKRGSTLPLAALALILMAAPWVATAGSVEEPVPTDEALVQTPAETLELQLELTPKVTPAEPLLQEPKRIEMAIRKCNDSERQLCPAGCICVVGDNGVECRPRPWNPELCW